MYIDFDRMPAQARTWVYQASRDLNEKEIKSLEEQLRLFIQQWTAHQAALLGSFKFFYHRFLVISVDESRHGASGCSIDASVHFIQKLGVELGLDFFDRQVIFLEEDQLITIPLQNLKQCISEGRIRKETPVFNNSVATLEAFQNNWLLPSEKSWLARYFKV